MSNNDCNWPNMPEPIQQQFRRINRPPVNIVRFKDPLYICDPIKNTECKGRLQMHCGVQCFCTKDPEKSKDPENKITNEAKYNSIHNMIMKKIKECKKNEENR